MSEKPSLEFVPNPKGTEGYIVYAAASTFCLGVIEWDEANNKFGYIPNANARMMKVLQDADMQNELRKFCELQTEEKLKSGGGER